MQLYLGVTPREVRDASRFTRSFAHVAYRIGPDSTLLRRDLLLETRGGLLSVSDRDASPVEEPEKLASAVQRECGRRSYIGVVLDFEDAPCPDRRAFASVLAPLLARSGRSLFVPEAYAGVSGAVVLVNTALSGGSYSARLQEAAAQHPRVALDVQRLAMDFPLPSRSGEGEPLTREQFRLLTERESPAVFFSQELCARYFTYQRDGKTHFILYDDAETIACKLRTADALGIHTALVMYPEVSDLLPALFRQGGGH